MEEAGTESKDSKLEVSVFHGLAIVPLAKTSHTGKPKVRAGEDGTVDSEGCVKLGAVTAEICIISNFGF